MALDVKTLFLLTMYIEAILGLLLLLVWVQNLSMRAVGWWGAAHLLRCGSVALYGLHGSIPSLIAIDLASAVLFTSYGVTWTGARVFNGRQPLPGSLITGAAVWLLACQSSVFAEASMLRALVSGGIIATFSWLAAYEFWRGRSENLVSRWPAIVLLFVHGAIFLLRTPLSTLLPATAEDGALTSAWLTVISAEALLFTISIAFVLVAMAKERTELSHRNAARIDALTGLANRRAFFQDAEALVQLQTGRARPVAVFLLDLDHFKSINDRFGHPMGDRVLRLFAQVTMANLRSSDLVGRLGGEEFGVLLADATRDNAFLVAERLRSAFEAAAKMGDDPPLAATVSIGVAIIQDPHEDLSTLLTKADQALYRAKARGRNRVELAPMDLLGEGAQPADAETAAAAEADAAAIPLAKAVA
jgi:diguanylate cyclase (GGDEF)-like protein